MAKGVGLDAGEFEVKAVELDGSARRPRLAKVVVQRIEPRAADQDDAARATQVAAAAKAALDAERIGRDHMAFAFPGREAVLRILTVPFVGDDRIRKVIKFEAEGSIHSHSVDDMVVDFHTVAGGETDTKVLVAAVPKAPLRATLAALEEVGIEPLTVDLDTMALLRAADLCGALDAQAAKPEAGAADADAALPVAAAPTTIVLDLGARSTKVLVVSEHKLIDMRVLRTGADTVTDEVGTAVELEPGLVRDAVIECLATGKDCVVDLEPTPVTGDADADADVAARPKTDLARARRVTAATVRTAHQHHLGRLRRELLRFMTSVTLPNRITAVWLTGSASTAPGIAELFEELFGVVPQQLDVLAAVSHKLDDEEARALSPKLAVAVGLALSQLGAKPAFNLRQEDLVFTKGFDRIKFPLAITCMLGLFLVLVLALRAQRELTNLESQFGAVYKIEQEARRGQTVRRVQFNGYVGCLVNAPSGWFANPTYFKEPEYRKLVDKLLEAPTFNRLAILKQEVKRTFADSQRASGYYPELRLCSGLGAVVELTAVLKSIEPSLGRYLLTDLDLKLPHDDKARALSCELILRSDDQSSFRDKWETVLKALRAVAGTPGSSFAKLSDKDTDERSTFDGEGSQGAYYQVKIELKPEDSPQAAMRYPVFPKKVTQ